MNIYALLSPEGAIRYIGKTKELLSKRLSQHLAESRGGEINHRCNWIRSLLAVGKLPTVQLLREALNRRIAKNGPLHFGYHHLKKTKSERLGAA